MSIMGNSHLTSVSRYDFVKREIRRTIGLFSHGYPVHGSIRWPGKTLFITEYLSKLSRDLSTARFRGILCVSSTPVLLRPSQPDFFV